MNPAQKQTLHSNPTPQDPVAADDSQGVVQGMYGLSNNFIFKKEQDITYKEKESSSTHQTLHTLHSSLMPGVSPTVTEQVDEAWGEGCRTVDSILKYAVNKSRCLGRSEVQKCLKRQGRR